MKKWLLVASIGLVCSGAAFPDQPLDQRVEAILNEGMETNLIVIADTSGSMRERPASGEEQPKIEIAKSALTQFVKALPPTVQIGLMMFHGCQPTWVSPLGGADRNTLLARVDRLRAMGSTPIATALKLAFKELKSRATKNPYGRNVILLVTDGEETCEPPAEVVTVANQITASGVEIHAIGFDLPDRDSDLKKVSTTYYYASDSKGLAAGLSTVQAELSMDGQVNTIGPGQ
jgi:Ca-activated chloride channel family protein